MKLSQLLATKKVIASGFAAISGLSALSRGTEEVVLSSLAPSVLAAQGVTEYYALQLPRGAVYTTPEEIIAADLDVRKYRIEYGYGAAHMDVVIVSRHQGTIDLLTERYQYSSDLQVHASVAPEQIAGKHVVGTLPPHLIAAAGAYTAVTIRGFDHAKDGDLTGDELAERLIIADKPIRVVELPEDTQGRLVQDGDIITYYYKSSGGFVGYVNRVNNLWWITDIHDPSIVWGLNNPDVSLITVIGTQLKEGR